MKNLIFPKRVSIRLVTELGLPFRQADILIRIRLTARQKNNFTLGPYPTNNEGIAAFTEGDLNADVEATYDSGLMDYGPVEECLPHVHISLYSIEDLSRALEARTTVWTSLLNGEEGRWNSIEELQRLYRRAAISTHEILNVASVQGRAEWSATSEEFRHSLVIRISDPSTIT